MTTRITVQDNGSYECEMTQNARNQVVAKALRQIASDLDGPPKLPPTQLDSVLGLKGGFDKGRKSRPVPPPIEWATKPPEPQTLRNAIWEALKWIVLGREPT